MAMRLSALALVIACVGSLVSVAAQTPVGTVISNQATVSFTDHGGQSFISHSDIARLTVAAGARLAATIDALPNPVAPGDSLTVDVIIENPGNTEAQEVVLTVVTDVVGSVTALADSAAVVEGLQISWPPAQIRPGARLVRRFRVHVDSMVQHGSDFGFEATVIAANIDGPLLLTSRVDIDLAPSLVLTKSADRDSVAAGGVIEHAIRCANTGNATARGVRVRDDVANALTPAFSSRPFTKAGSVLTWDLGDLEAGSSVSFQLLVRVGDGAVTGNSLLNQVSATAMATGLDGAPRSFVSESPMAFVIVIDPALSLAKTVQSELPVPGRGDVITYRLELTNAAAIAAGPVVLRDTLPEPLRFTSAEAEVPVSVGGQIVEARWSDVAAGSTVLLSILTRVDSVDALPELITNRAWAESSTSVIPSNAVETTLRLDEPTDGELEQPIRIFAGADLTIEVRDADANHHPTEIDTFAVRVANQRSGESESVLLPETGVDTGAFVGAVGTAHSQEPGEEEDGHLFAVPADQLVGTYSDLLTASGEPAQRLAQTEVAATAIVLRVYPDAIVANRTERAIFTATLTDDEDRPLPDGTLVVWRTDAGVFTEVSVDDDGQAMTTTAGGVARPGWR